MKTLNPFSLFESNEKNGSRDFASILLTLWRVIHRGDLCWSFDHKIELFRYGEKETACNALTQ